MRTFHRIKCLTGSRETKELTRGSRSRQSFTIYAVSVPGEEEGEGRERGEGGKTRPVNTPVDEEPQTKIKDLVTNLSRKLSDLTSSYEDSCTQTCNLS